MGNWHCISSSCATVHYREYLGGKIRWRYGAEPWQEIAGDDYTTEVVPDLAANTTYQLVYRLGINPSNGQPQQWSTTESILSGQHQFNGIESWFIRIVWNSTTYNRYPPQALFSFFTENGNVQPNAGLRSANYSLIVQSQGQQIIKNLGNYTSPLWFIRLQAVDPAKRKTNCIFKVRKNGNVVYTETRAVCPEVQKIPCQLSTIEKQIEIQKIPYLEKVEVVPYQYSAYKFPNLIPPIVQTDPIPSECLNIYNNAIFVIPPSGQGIYPNAKPFNSFIAQICSAPGCPPPEYQVICDCNNCESCPDGTCVVECEGQICCYGSDGVSVKSIALENYCGGQS
jgi:hypothetical protein